MCCWNADVLSAWYFLHLSAWYFLLCMLSMQRSCKESWQQAMPCAQPRLMASTSCGSPEYGQRSWHWALGTGAGADLPATFLHARPAPAALVPRGGGGSSSSSSSSSRG
jgi:hypothetical protein